MVCFFNSLKVFVCGLVLSTAKLFHQVSFGNTSRSSHGFQGMLSKDNLWLHEGGYVPLSIRQETWTEMLLGEVRLSPWQRSTAPRHA